MTTGWLELRSNQNLSNSYRSLFNRTCIAARDAAVNLSKVNPVIVGEFAFQHHVVVYPISESSAHAEVISLCLGNAKIIQKKPGFETFLRVRETRISAQEKDEYREHDLPHQERAFRGPVELDARGLFQVGSSFAIPPPRDSTNATQRICPQENAERDWLRPYFGEWFRSVAISS
jgi:hypothetical protein